jgi:hypothetical protein
MTRQFSSPPAFRHPELVSGYILPFIPLVSVARWMLKQVQHDEVFWGTFAPSRLRVSPLSRHPREGGGPSPELPVCLTGPVMDSRLRGNDEVWGGGELHVRSATSFVPSCLRASHT